MKANVIYKGEVYENVELSTVKPHILSFMIPKSNKQHDTYLDKLNQSGAGMGYFTEYTLAIVSREYVSRIDLL